jgi:hypothetical protein
MDEANALLALKTPEQLFSGDAEKAKHEFYALAQRWHPDRNPDKLSASVFAHISALYDEAIRKLENNLWDGTGVLRAEGLHGRLEIPYRRRCSFELGSLYLADERVVYVLDAKYRDLYDNAQRMLGSFVFASNRMQQEIQRYLPHDFKTFQLRDGRLGLEIPKAPEFVRLRDVVKHLGGRIEPRHVAWILSTLHNLVCYLEYAKITHNDISLDTYFISPAQHSGALLGGWWYAVRSGAELKQVPRRTYELLPWSVRTKKRAESRTDLDLVRAVGRELLGSGLATDTTIPTLLVEWLRNVSTGDAVRDYDLWRKALKDAFGPRRFVKMEVTADNLYGKA